MLNVQITGNILTGNGISGGVGGIGVDHSDGENSTPVLFILPCASLLGIMTSGAVSVAGKGLMSCLLLPGQLQELISMSTSPCIP